jgi:uncharacterized small protein (DUF1192 family)
MNQQINAWLNSERNYQQGVALYERYGSSATQKRLLRKGGETKKNLDILVYELGKLNASTVIIQPVRPIAKPLVVKEKKPPAILPRTNIPEGKRPNTPEADQVKQMAIDKLKVQSNLQSTLHLLDTKEKRQDAADQIISLDKEIRDLYERLDHFNKHGVLPPEKKTPELPVKDVSTMSVDELYRRRGTLQTYISRYKIKAGKAATEKAQKKNIDLLDRYSKELDAINKRLGK